MRCSLALAISNANDLRLTFKTADNGDTALGNIKMLRQGLNNGLICAALLGWGLDPDAELSSGAFFNGIFFGGRLDLDRVFHRIPHPKNETRDLRLCFESLV